MSLSAPPHDILSTLRAQDADLHLVVLLSPAPVRTALATLFSYDATLATAAAASADVMVNCIRLAWWREQVEGLAQSAPTASLPAPLLLDMRDHILPLGIEAVALAALEAPWADILEQDTPASAQDLTGWCCARGGALFDLATQILAPAASAEVRAALHHYGHIWALAQWVRSEALEIAELPTLPAPIALPPALRPLAALGQLAFKDVQRARRKPTALPVRKGSPRRLLHLLFSSLRNR